MTLTESLVATAAKWRESNQEYKGGVVLIWQGDAYGWKDRLRDPAHEKPGAFAVDSDGHVFIAEGGNEYDGAKGWVAFSADVGSQVDNQLQHQNKHCGFCGNTHSGNCKPDSFAYFQCSDCKGGQMMPFDACFGFEHIHCCDNEKSAADTWKSITHEQYKQLKVQL